jgi:superfamily II DNA or RNA helicase
MFTATPFRRDKHQLQATSVYTYSLGQALDDGVLAAIDFVPVDMQASVTEEFYDVALANGAAADIASPEHQAAQSRIIARTRTVKHAEELVEIYREAGVAMGLITASTSDREVRRILDRLDVGDLIGLVSVSVLGEGFDFPTLKVGVYYRRHASLPSTLADAVSGIAHLHNITLAG